MPHNKAIILLLVVIIILISNVYSQKMTKIDKGVHWSNRDAQIFLYEGKNDNYNVTVISDKKISVVYQTSVNSSFTENKKLKPICVDQKIRTYKFRHNFSKTTIWMSLKFSIAGNEIDELYRAFYNGLYNTVDIDQCISPMENAVDELFKIKLPPVPGTKKK